MNNSADRIVLRYSPAGIPTLAVEIQGLLDLTGNATLLDSMSEEVNVRPMRLCRIIEIEGQEMQGGVLRDSQMTCLGSSLWLLLRNRRGYCSNPNHFARGST